MAKEIITYFSKQVQVACDELCSKAWGINSRPSVQLSDDDDDYEFLADGELPQAPADPGTYEGGFGKPVSVDYFPNKWCVRECERCIMRDIEYQDAPIAFPDYSRRIKNMLEDRSS